MDLVKHLSPSIIKDKPYTFDEGYLSTFCRFEQLMLCLPPLHGFEIDMNMKF